jgi:hypothetical protein
MIIEPKFESASSFTEHLAQVSQDGKAGYIDATGTIIIQPQFDRAEGFSEGLAAVQVGEKWGYVQHS